MTEEFHLEQEQADNTMFRDAAAALRAGDKKRAKELLTLLLKADQNNPVYWIWLSAAVDSTKERIYCLQVALKFDPENKTAKRGLLLLGALVPDENVPPFRVARPRAWEENLLLANEKPRAKGIKALTSNPMLRLAGIGALILALFAAAVFGLALPRRVAFVPTPTFTPGPSPTFTATPTLLGAAPPEPTKAVFGPTPLWMKLSATYTPTPIYVNTPHGGASGAYYRQAQNAYQNGNWDDFIFNMQAIATFEPNAADVPYWIAEAYRAKGDNRKALQYYNDALKLDDKFGPAYLGLALVRLNQDPAADVEFLFEEAAKYSPDYGMIYLESARYRLGHKDPKGALADLAEAAKLMPDSAHVYLLYADVYASQGEMKKALQSAEKAYSVDLTAEQTYKTLGKLCVENGLYERAIDALETYIVYYPRDAESLALMGRAYYELSNFEAAVENLDKAFDLSRSGFRRYYVYRGLAYLELENADKAADDLERAAEVEPQSYPITLGLARAYYLQEKFGSAFQKIVAAKAFAKTDKEKALAFYWSALIQEKRDQRPEAVKDWKEMLALGDAATDEMRRTAEEHLKSIVTPTYTPKGGKKTATPTPTPKPRTPTPTPKGGASTATPTPTSTPKK